MSDKTREGFEVCIRSLCDSPIDSSFALDRDGDGYDYGRTNDMWDAWRASREALVIDLPKSHSSRNREVIKAVGSHIIAQGIKVKA